MQAKFNEARDKVQVLESLIKALGDVKHLEDRRKVISDELKANKRKITEYLVKLICRPFRSLFLTTILQIGFREAA